MIKSKCLSFLEQTKTLIPFEISQTQTTLLLVYKIFEEICFVMTLRKEVSLSRGSFKTRCTSVLYKFS